MPGFNGTGPRGFGPGTGRGIGPCGGGAAYSRGGRGSRWKRFLRYTPPSKKEEKEMLSEEAKILEEELKNIKSRLAQLKDKK